MNSVATETPVTANVLPVPPMPLAAGQRPDSHPAAALVQILHGMQSREDLSGAAEWLVRQFRQLVGCDTAALGISRGGTRTCRLIALSGVAQPDRKSEPVRLIESAMDEALAHDRVVSWPSSVGDAPSRPMEQLAASLRCESVCAVGLRTPDGRKIAALMMAGDGRQLESRAVVAFIQAIRGPLATTLDWMVRAEPGFFESARRRLKGIGRPAVVVVIALLVGLLFCPVPHRISCDAELQPVSRRYVVAPFAGQLDRSVVEPGQVVTRNEVLACMDAEEIKLQRSAIVAKCEQAEKKRDVALAKGDSASAQVAKLDLLGCELELKLLDRRLGSLEIKSPVDGVVVSGDLKRVEGAPLTAGQSLFEIAPLDAMVVELAIEEDRISFVRPGATVRLYLNSFPGATWDGTVEKIHPRSEVVKDRTVFVAEFRLKNFEGRMRPGMTGRARVACGRRPLGSLLIVEPAARMIARLGW